MVILKKNYVFYVSSSKILQIKITDAVISTWFIIFKYGISDLRQSRYPAVGEIKATFLLFLWWNYLTFE